MFGLSRFKVFYKDKLNFWLINASLLLILSTWLLFLLKKFHLSSLAIIHYNIYFGFDILGHWRWLFILPALSLLLSIFDSLVALYLWTKQAVWSQFLLLAALLLNFAMFIFLFNILTYNV